MDEITNKLENELKKAVEEINLKRGIIDKKLRKKEFYVEKEKSKIFYVLAQYNGKKLNGWEMGKDKIAYVFLENNKLKGCVIKSKSSEPVVRALRRISKEYDLNL